MLSLQMYSKGFKNLEAIDASAQMLEKAKNLGVYENFYVENHWTQETKSP